MCKPTIHMCKAINRRTHYVVLLYYTALQIKRHDQTVQREAVTRDKGQEVDINMSL